MESHKRKMQINDDDPFKKLFVTEEHQRKFDDMNNPHKPAKSMAVSPKATSELILPELRKGISKNQRTSNMSLNSLKSNSNG